MSSATHEAAMLPPRRLVSGRQRKAGGARKYITASDDVVSNIGSSKASTTRLESTANRPSSAVPRKNTIGTNNTLDTKKAIDTTPTLSNAVINVKLETKNKKTPIAIQLIPSLTPSAIRLVGALVDFAR